MSPQVDGSGRAIASDGRPTVRAEDGIHAMRAAIIEYMRAQRGHLVGPSREPTLSLIEPRIEPAEPMISGPAFMAAVWSLVRDGIIVPGVSKYQMIQGYHSNRGTDAFPYFTVTQNGEALLQCEDVDPLDRASFLAAARTRLGQADERIYTYLAEANESFQHACYLSAAIMLGVSAELLMKWLIDKFIDHVGVGKRPDFEKTRDEFWMRTDKLFDAFVKAFSPHYREFSKDLQYQAEANLDMLQTLIRINRDDAGHGRVQRVDREMVHGHLFNYLTLLKLARELADAFASSCSVYP